MKNTLRRLAIKSAALSFALITLAGCVYEPYPPPPPPGPVAVAPAPYGYEYPPYYGPAYYGPPVGVSVGFGEGWHGGGYRHWH